MVRGWLSSHESPKSADSPLFLRLRTDVLQLNTIQIRRQAVKRFANPGRVFIHGGLLQRAAEFCKYWKAVAGASAFHLVRKLPDGLKVILRKGCGVDRNVGAALGEIPGNDVLHTFFHLNQILFRRRRYFRLQYGAGGPAASALFRTVLDQSFQQRDLADWLGEKGREAGFHSANRHLRKGVRGESQNRGRRRSRLLLEAADLGGGLITVHYRHFDIHQDHVVMPFPELPGRYLAILGDLDPDLRAL